MQSEIIARPATAAVKIFLEMGETIVTESGSMLAMSEHLRIETTSRTRKGGMLSGLKRLFAGENFFLNHFTAVAAQQELLLAPALLGDITHHVLETGTLIAQATSWLASNGTVHIDTTWQGFSSALFSGEGIFWLRLSGQGDIWFNSFGAIYTIDVEDSYIVDTGHIVAFEDTLKFSIRKASHSWIGSFLGGEGLVCEFKGRGKLYCQTHNPPTFGSVLGPMLKPRRE